MIKAIRISGSFRKTDSISAVSPRASTDGAETLDLFADSANGQLYVSHGTEVEVVDLASEKPTGKITGMKRIHGIASDGWIHCLGMFNRAECAAVRNQRAYSARG